MAWIYQSSGGSGYIIAKKQQFAIAIKRNFIMLAMYVKADSSFMTFSYLIVETAWNLDGSGKTRK